MSRTKLAEAEQELTGWQANLIVGQFKQPLALIENALIALRLCPLWEGVLSHDEFALVTMMEAPPPWLREEHNAWERCRWADDDDVRTLAWLQQNGIRLNSLHTVAAAVLAVARENGFHPIKDYLAALDWDGADRVAGFAANFLGADRTPYHEAVSQVLFISAVARIFEPGCKADHVVVLEGAQGTYKSTALKVLFEPYFSDDISELGSKDAAMQVRVAWGIELPELSAMSAAETEKIKAFISRSVDKFRPSYGRHVIAAPRQSVMIGTTNAEAYLRDETGNRRFLPIRCGRIDIAGIRRAKHQLWAEAVALYEQKTPWWIADKAILATVEEEQSNRFAADVWEDRIAGFVAEKDDVSVAEVLEYCLLIEPGRWSRGDQMRVGRCLTRLGWERYLKRTQAGREWRYHLSPLVTT